MVIGTSGVRLEDNEKADEMARKGAATPLFCLVCHKPFCDLADIFFKGEIRK